MVCLQLPDETYNQANHESPECPSLVGPRPKDGQDVDGADRGGQEAGDGLDVDEELGPLGALDDWNPDYADNNQDQHETSAQKGQFRLPNQSVIAAMSLQVDAIFDNVMNIH